MPAAAADSALYRVLFSDDETAALFSDSAEVRAMLLVEGALARVQGELGLIPAEAAAFIDRSSREVVIDPSALAVQTATNGVPIPGFLAAFRKAMEAPDYAQYLHWGATSQDIMDTALALRLRRVLDLWRGRLVAIIKALGAMAETHAQTPMAARTYGQVATPTSFGAVIAAWGQPLERHLVRLDALRDEVLEVSLSGAAGTLSAMGDAGPAVRAGLAKALNLRDPGQSTHATRDRIGALAAWAIGVSTSLGKMGEDLILMTQSGIDEVALAGAGGSSTMPQKQNPVGPSVLVALARQIQAVGAGLQGAGLHRQQRDGAAWFIEWLTLPQVAISTGRSLALALDLTGGITARPEQMLARLDDGSGLIFAESLSFALARHLPRPDAQAKIKDLCKQAKAQGPSLVDLLKAEYPQWDLAADGGLGTATADARAFAVRAKAVA